MNSWLEIEKCNPMSCSEPGRSSVFHRSVTVGNPVASLATRSWASVFKRSLSEFTVTFTFTFTSTLNRILGNKARRKKWLYNMMVWYFLPRELNFKKNIRRVLFKNKYRSSQTLISSKWILVYFILIPIQYIHKKNDLHRLFSMIWDSRKNGGKNLRQKLNKNVGKRKPMRNDTPPRRGTKFGGARAWEMIDRFVCIL